MNRKKILVLSILVIFCIGMTLGAASASHTFKLGKYKGKISDKQYKKLQSAKKKGKEKLVYGKTKQYKTYKIPKFDKNGKKIGYKKVKSKVKMTVETTTYKGKYNGDYVIFFTENGPIGANKIVIKAKSPLKKVKNPYVNI